MSTSKVSRRASTHRRPTTRAKLVSMSAVLDDRQLQIIRMRFLHGMTQADIAGEIGVSQQRVNKIIHGSLRALRDYPAIVLDLRSDES